MTTGLIYCNALPPTPVYSRWKVAVRRCCCEELRGNQTLAQLVERKTLNLVVVGSSPTVGVLFVFFFFFLPLSPFCMICGPGHHSVSSCGAVGSAWVS